MLGTVHNACFISPLGNYLSIYLQQALNAAASRATAARIGASSKWWGRGRDRVGLEPPADLALLQSALTEAVRQPAWCRPIGLLVSRGSLPLRFCLMRLMAAWAVGALRLRSCGGSVMVI